MRERELLAGFWQGTPKVKSNLADLIFREDNVKMDLRVIAWDDVDWVDLAKDRDTWRAPVNTVMNLEGL